MADKCFPLIRGRRFRFTALDGCGRRKTGSCVSIVSDGIVTVSISSRTEDAEAITIVNSNGRRIVNDTGTPSFSGHGAEITLADVSPELIGMLTGNKVVYDANGDAIGFRTSTKIDLSKTGFALEVWMDVPGVTCDEDDESEGQWGYVLIPFLSGGVLGDFEIGNSAVSFTVTGAATKDSSGWGVGPYNIQLVGATPTPLTEPMEADEPLHVQIVNLAPPEPACSCESEGVAPLTALRGAPGTFGPTDAYAPEGYPGIQDLVMASRTVNDGVTVIGATVTSATASFQTSDIGAKISGGSIPAGATITARASATSVTISAPATASGSAVALTITQSQAWTAGQYVEAANGDRAHWTGTAWAPGVAV